MDELVHHCLRELSFDGDLGCSVSRLRDFIVGFYTIDATHPQTVDDSFCAFVWSLIVQQPTVRVGTIPPGAATEVYIATQTSAKRKAEAKGEEIVVEHASTLDVVPDATNRSLDDLKAQYGDGLRIAVDRDTSFAAITGSHLRPSKLSPMVYTALQFITRGREQGISVVDLGKKTKYDQKTCFYLVKQLIDLDLIVKKKKSGVGTNFVIHKYFYDRDLSWQQIRNEEAQAEETPEVEPQVPDDSQSYEDDSKVAISFDPIDTRHLSSLPLVRGRLVKLLKASQNNIHSSTNMLVAIGFPNPTRTDRRFFQTRLRELVAAGVVERVSVLNKQHKGTSTHTKCIRLLSPDDNTNAEGNDAIVESQAVADDGKDIGFEDSLTEDSGLKMNLTIHKQISDLLEEAGTRGMTLSELCNSLCKFDKRTIELLLTRAEKNQPPSHLSDLGTAELMETFGRERRHRYYTVAAFRALVAREGLDDFAASYADIDYSATGGFASVAPDAFYEDEETLVTYTDSFKDKHNAGIRKYKLKNPILPDGSVKIGRPRKISVKDAEKGKSKATPAEAGNKRGYKRKREVGDQEDADSQETYGEPAIKPRRGRPPKKLRLDADARAKGDDQVDAQWMGGEGSTEVASPEKRGRPPQKKLSDSTQEAGRPNVDHSPNSKEGTDRPPVPKKRGRPSKQKPEVVDQLTADGVQQTHGEDGQSMSTSEDAPPQKRGRVTNERQTVLESNKLLTQTSDHATDTLVLLTARSPPPELGDASVRNVVAVSPQFHPDEARRSPRERKPIVRADNSILTKQTPRKKTVVAKATKPAARTIPEPASVVNRRPSQATQDQMSNRSVNLTMDRLPLQSSGSSPAVHPNDSRNTAASVPVNSALAMDADGHDIISEPNIESGPSSQLVKLVNEATQAPARSKVNVSQLRRENELVRVIEVCGGMINTHTKEFFEAHMDLVETMTQAGEPTSAPIGTRLDKRTAETTLNSMASRGRIKMLKTSLLTSTGATRPASIIYLPTVEQNALNSFLVDLSRSYSSPVTHFPPVKKIDEPLNYGSAAQIQRAALPLQLLQMEDHGGDDKERWSRNAARAAQLFTFDDATIREVLLAERTTLAQLYGFIVGKAMRARLLHLITLDFFDRQVSSPRIVSLEHRIVDISFFYHDLQLSSFCSLIGSLVHDDELDQFLQTLEGKETPVEKIPANLHTSLQVGRARTRSRFLDLFEFLRSLGLVTPLRASDSNDPQYISAPNGDHPTAFDVAPLEGWSITASFNAPTYWHFNESAPLHFWSQSEISPPFWKDMPVVTFHDAAAYWHDLDQACRNRDLPQKTPGPSVGSASGSATVPLSPSIGVARSLRREVSWNGSYTLTWHQEQYLHRFVDRTTGDTPIQDEEAGEAQLQKICWVVSAPREAVEKYFGKARRKITKELDKVRQRKKREVADEEAGKAMEARALLQRKAAKAKLQREKDWDDMLLRIHPEPLEGSATVRVRRVRSRFLQSSTGRDTRKWEGEITQAVREIKMAVKQALPEKKPPLLPGPVHNRGVPPPIVINHPKKSVQDLIAQQGPPRPSKEPTKQKGKGKRQDIQEDPSGVQPKPPVRRGRFQWNREYDELARDASTIIRARCRDGPRIDWAALEQIFPAVPRNSVRQRIVALKEVPGADAYLKRLEDRWYDLWSQHRGTENLPDDHPQSPSKFDLISHVEFLRRHIDKNAIRVGFAVQTSHINLPASVDEVDGEWEIFEKPNTGPVWEFHWNALVDEGREKNLLRHPFTTHAPDIPISADISTETVYLAESVVKMVFGAPNESYDPECASRLLHSMGEEPTSAATSNLLNRGVLSKSMRDPKQIKPGRTLKISEVNQNALGGSIPRDTFQDASAFEDIIPEEGDNWQQWPILATDGDTAALIQLISEDKVGFKIDTSLAQAARPSLDWNSKKADDDQIETLLSVRFHDVADPAPELHSSEASPSASRMEFDNDTTSVHGVTIEGQVACCKQESDGLIDCLCCLEADLSAFLNGLDPADAALVQHISTTVREAAAKGVSKDQLFVRVSGPTEHILILVHHMTELSPPLLFWAGYSSSVLVSSTYLQAWTVLISEKPRVRIFPRRWLDLGGKNVPDVWESALKAVVGVVVSRPGVSQTELRWRLRSVYDRQEVNDVLRYLQQEGVLKRRWNPELGLDEREETRHVLALDDMEEKNTFWFIGGGKHWYQV